MELEIEQIE